MLICLKLKFKTHSRVLISLFVVLSLFCGFNSFYYTGSPYNQKTNVINKVTSKQKDSLDDSNWTPISETVNFSFNDNLHLINLTPQIIEYNLLTKTENLKEINNSAINQLTEMLIPPSKGILEEDYNNQNIQETEYPQISYPFPPDDRERVTATSNYPWRTICKLFITAQDNTKFIGSGAIIDEFHILTCGHCIYIHENGGWISELEVIPGMDDTYEPFGHAYGTYFRTYTDWTQNEMEEHDWAVVTLDRSIGSFTGWMGRRTADPSSSIYTGVLNTAGYPGDLNNGFYMYYDSDYGEDADEYNHWFWMDTAGGQSGSSVWQYDGENRYILSIVAYEYEDGAYANFGTRLNQDKFDRINTWLSEDSSSPPDDRPDLLDRGYYSGVSPTSVVPGKTVFSIYCDVKNDGTTTSSLFNVDFYASEDLSISTADFLIGSTSIASLTPFTYILADWSGIFPSNIPIGSYFIGWIIDANNNINEFNENNNIVINSNLQIDVRSRISRASPDLLIPILITVPIVLVAVAVVIVIIKKYIDRMPDFTMDELPEELNDF